MNNRRLLRAFSLIFAMFTLTACFLSGCNSEKSSYRWVRSVIDKYYYEDLPSDCQYNGSVKEFVSEYLDIYSDYYTREEYEAVYYSNSGKKSGYGFSYYFLEETDGYPGKGKGVLIASVVGNSPAFYSGLQAGEFVLSGEAEGRKADFTTNESFTNFLYSVPEGKSVKFITDRGEHTLTASDYTSSYCYMATATSSWNVTYEGNAPKLVKTDDVGIPYLPEGAAYIGLSQFYGNAHGEMAMLMGQFNAHSCTSLILDLRGNGGGYVDVMSDMSYVFTGLIPNALSSTMYAVYKNGEREEFNKRSDFTCAPSEMLPVGTKVSVLADNGTASASEALIGTLISNGVMDYGDVYVSDFSEEYLAFVGMPDRNCRTYGKGIMQATIVRPITGEALKLTTAKIYWPDGKTCIHDVGLNVEAGCKTVKTDWDVIYGDKQLADAVAMIYS